MKLCRNCGAEMMHTMSFWKDNNKVKQVSFFKCKKCGDRTRPVKLILK